MHKKPRKYRRKEYEWWNPEVYPAEFIEMKALHKYWLFSKRNIYNSCEKSDQFCYEIVKGLVQFLLKEENSVTDMQFMNFVGEIVRGLVIAYASYVWYMFGAEVSYTNSFVKFFESLTGRTIQDAYKEFFE